MTITKATEFNIPIPGDLYCDVEITRSSKGVVKITSANQSVQLNVREARLLFKWLELALPDTLPRVR